jgi:type IV secretory pathway TraG/TraD family ATPase VirD4
MTLLLAAFSLEMPGAGHVTPATVKEWMGSVFLHALPYFVNPIFLLGFILILAGVAFIPTAFWKRFLSPFFWFMVICTTAAVAYFWPRVGPVSSTLWIFALIAFIGPASPFSGGVAVRIGGIEWDINNFCRGWLITGATGSGKTQCGINRLMFECFKNMADWGGVCIDEKGTYWDILVAMAKHFRREKDLILLQTRPMDAPDGWKPPARFNLLSDNRIPAEAYAVAIVKAAQNVIGGEGDKGFFKQKAQDGIKYGISLLRLIERMPSLADVHNLLTNKKLIEQLLADIAPLRETNPEALQTYNDMKAFISQPDEQYGGVEGTIGNYLSAYTHPEIAEVFCSDDNTCDLMSLDAGKILCVAMPQRFSAARAFICTLLKELAYFHIRSRFDDKKTIKKKNVIVIWQDEAQRFATDSDGNVDVIREAKGTTVISTQGQGSLFKPLGGKEVAKVILSNLRNRIIMQSAEQDCADLSAEYIGKHEVWKKSYSSSATGGSVSRSKEEQFKVKPFELQNLKKFEAFVCHCEGLKKRMFIRAIEPDGTVPTWFKERFGPWWRFITG